ncbi:MAG: hypothetical protein ACLGH0_14415, partial [Thermoanaerobaculia bacterium]
MRALVLSLALAVPLFSQPLFVGKPAPVSVARTGVPVATSVFDHPIVVSNGTGYLVLWMDWRTHAPGVLGGGTGQAMRFAADGT